MAIARTLCMWGPVLTMNLPIYLLISKYYVRRLRSCSQIRRNPQRRNSLLSEVKSRTDKKSEVVLFDESTVQSVQFDSQI